MFGLLRGHCEGANVFDGFAGTGALGLEVVSRGAARCVLVEQDKSIAAILSKNVEMLGVKDRCEVVVGDALGAGALARSPRPLTLAFLDPPYPLVQEPVGFRRVMAQMEKLVEVLRPDGFAVLRTPWPLRHREGPAPVMAALVRRSKRRGPRDDRHDWRREVERGAPGRADHASEVDQEVGEGPENPIQIAAKEVWLDVDLTLPNARGPETHAYHNMAVHLYMKK